MRRGSRIGAAASPKASASSQRTYSPGSLYRATPGQRIGRPLKPGCDALVRLLSGHEAATGWHEMLEGWTGAALRVGELKPGTRRAKVGVECVATRADVHGVRWWRGAGAGKKKRTVTAAHRVHEVLSAGEGKVRASPSRFGGVSWGGAQGIGHRSWSEGRRAYCVRSDSLEPTLGPGGERRRVPEANGLPYRGRRNLIVMGRAENNNERHVGAVVGSGVWLGWVDWGGRGRSGGRVKAAAQWGSRRRRPSPSREVADDQKGGSGRGVDSRRKRFGEHSEKRL